MTRCGSKVLPLIPYALGLVRAMMLREPWDSLIVDGIKVWEVRKQNITWRGRIAVARVGSGMLVGEVTIVGSFFMSMRNLRLSSSVEKHMLTSDSELSSYAG